MEKLAISSLSKIQLIISNEKVYLLEEYYHKNLDMEIINLKYEEERL